MQHYPPGVDEDGGSEPIATIVEEEDHVIVVLTVEVFLVGHRIVVGTLDEETVVDDRNVDDLLVVALVHDMQSHVVSFDEPVCGYLGHDGRYSGHGSAIMGGDTGGTAAHGPCAIGELLVTEEVVDAVEASVVVGEVEAEICWIEVFAAKILQYDAEAVGIFGEVDGGFADATILIVGHVNIACDTEEEGCEIVVDLSVVVVDEDRETGGIFPVNDIVAIGIGVIITILAGGPHAEGVGTGLEVVDIHISLAHNVGHSLTLGIDTLSRGVIGIEGDGVNLMGEGIGEQHVHVEDETHAPVGGTVLTTVGPHHTTGGKEKRTHRYEEEREATQ